MCVKYSPYFLPHLTLEKTQTELVGGDSDHCTICGGGLGSVGVWQTCLPPSQGQGHQEVAQWCWGWRRGEEEAVAPSQFHLRSLEAFFWRFWSLWFCSPQDGPWSLWLVVKPLSRLFTHFGAVSRLAFWGQNKQKVLALDRAACRRCSRLLAACWSSSKPRWLQATGWMTQVSCAGQTSPYSYPGRMTAVMSSPVVIAPPPSEGGLARPGARTRGDWQECGFLALCLLAQEVPWCFYSWAWSWVTSTYTVWWHHRGCWAKSPPTQSKDSVLQRLRWVSSSWPNTCCFSALFPDKTPGELEELGQGDCWAEANGMAEWLDMQLSAIIPGFPGGASGKEPTSQCRCKRCGFHPWVEKIPWRRAQQPTPVLLTGKSHGQRNLVGYGPWGHKESDTTEAT